TVTATGGTPPYTYFWNNLATTQTITGLTPGTYDVVVTDANGCIDTTFAVVRAESDLTVEALIWNPECGDNSNGKVMAMVEGGVGPYTYVWSNGAVTQAIQDLAAGIYCVTVTDAEGCTASACADLESAPIPDVEIRVLNTVSQAGNDGSLQALPSNGTPAYAFNWSNGGNTPVISNLTAGRYAVTVTDNNFCQGESEIVLAGPGQISGNVFNDSNANGVRNFSDEGVEGITVRLLGRNLAGFRVELTTTTNAAGNYLFEGVSSGTYRVRFSDLPFRFIFSPQGNNPNPSLNSSVTNTALGETNEFVFSSSNFVEFINAGIYEGGGHLVEDVDIRTEITAENNVAVCWEVPMLVKNFAFVVERSNDGGKTFEVVGDDAITIEKNDMMEYRFTDNAPKRGRAYYRIGYVVDTELEYSNIVETMFSMPAFAMAYPNPAADEVMIELFSALSTDARVQLMDTSGRIIKNQKLSSGDMYQRLSVEGLNPGIYFIRVLRQDDTEPTLIRVIKR
ncbi:MAG: SdrD B-like domain-containing protein, partial [Bacteroidota bacterium]